MTTNRHHYAIALGALGAAMRKGAPNVQGKPIPRPKWRWWEKANCKGLDDEERMRIFFPELRAGPRTGDPYEEAHGYCKSCVVKNECKQSAIAEEGRLAEGYRGDTDHTARRKLYYDMKHKGLITESPTAGDGIIAKRENKHESVPKHWLAAPTRRKHKRHGKAEDAESQVQGDNSVGPSES